MHKSEVDTLAELFNKLLWRGGALCAADVLNGSSGVRVGEASLAKVVLKSVTKESQKNPSHSVDLRKFSDRISFVVSE